MIKFLNKQLARLIITLISKSNHSVLLLSTYYMRIFNKKPNAFSIRCKVMQNKLFYSTKEIISHPRNYK